MQSVSRIIYQCAKTPYGDTYTIGGTCRTCGLVGKGIAFARWVKDTFTDHDKLHPGDIVCAACLFGFDDANPIITKARQWWESADDALSSPVNAERIQTWRKKKNLLSDAIPSSPKDIGLRELFGGWGVPAKTRNFSHFVADGEWYYLSKGQKADMRRLLLVGCPVAVIADSGQKHLIFRARVGWWQFEEQALLPCSELLAHLLAPIEALYDAGASKTEIESGVYDNRTIYKIGVAVWQSNESQIKLHRGSLPFKLAVYLAQKEDADDGGNNEL